MPYRTPTALDLSEAERAGLQGWSRRRRTAQGLALRARIVLRAAEGLSNTAIADELGVAKHTVGKWRERFARLRADGLLDEPRPGAPRRIGDEQIAALVDRTLSTRPEGATHWSLRSMARTSGLSVTTVGRVWRAFGLQPHRAETFKLSTDPLFAEKVRANVPPDLDVHLVLDNSATHKTRAIRDWLAKRPRYHVHFTPTSASWINQVERWFGLLTERALRRGVHRSVADLERDIRAFIDATNAEPKPFRWGKSADDILAGVKRFCLRALGAATADEALARTSGAEH